MKCLNCNNPAIITKAGKQSKFCSPSCRSRYNSKDTLEKRKRTNLERYGVDNPSKSSEIIDARTASNIEKYGVANPFSLKEIQEKQQETMMKEYGVKFATQSDEFKEKQTTTWLYNYGSHPWANTEVRDKRKATLLEKYGVEHPILSDEILNKIRETCKQRYGNEIASKTQGVIEKIRKSQLSDEVIEKKQNTCIERYGATSFQLSLISHESREILESKEDFEPLILSYGISGTSNILGVSVDVVRSRVKRYDIDIPFKSELQQEILEYIRSLGVSNITTDTRKIISPKELDLYFEENKFAIEVNGSYWHSELNNRGSSYHLAKLIECINKKIDLFFVWEYLWTDKKEIIKSRISSKFGKNAKIYARLCKIVNVSKKEKKTFLETTHLQGNCSSSVEYGLEYNGKLVAVMTFGKPRFNKNVDWELLRFSTSLGINVIGAASRLFSHFIKTQSPGSVISYSDRQYGLGNVYSKLNFEHKGASPPNYYYTSDYRKFESRMKFQKHKLSKLLPVFDNSLSEWENMKNNGYDRVWDCGNDIWMWVNPSS